MQRLVLLLIASTGLQSGDSPVRMSMRPFSTSHTPSVGTKNAPRGGEYL